MKKLFTLILLFLFSCYKEEPQINDPNAIFNTKGWNITLYSTNNNSSNIFNNYIFEFTDNPAVGCAEWMDGKCPLGVYGGYYEIKISDGKTKFNIILPPAFNLNQITGLWEVVIINSNTIHLRRLSNTGNQKLIFSR